MKPVTQVFGRVVDLFNIPLDEINDLNNKYEQAKENLNSYGPKLAG